MINALKTTSLLGSSLSFKAEMILAQYLNVIVCNINFCWVTRKEELWVALDPLLIDVNDATPAVTTPYTAAILEYRVVFHDNVGKVAEETYDPKMNGHATHDVNHPCR